MTIVSGTRLGPYEITAKLGEGGMGEVYRARDTKLERDVAIKVLPAAFVEDHERLARFEREAKLLAQLHHPNIASIFGMEESESTQALVMELVEGPTLADRLESGSLPLEESLSIARQIAEALEEAHEKGIIHRDLKPQNIKASMEGRVKVLDFGLAKAMDPAGVASGAQSASQLAASPTLTLGATQMGVVLGTAAYMSPEQAKGFAVDKRADIWAFGVVLFEMLTGKRLFDAPTVPETLAQVLTREPELEALPASVPPAIRRLLRRCLERNPKNRLHDIADARIVIDDVASGRSLEPAVASAATTRSRFAWLPWSIAAAAVALAAGLFVTRGPKAQRPAMLRFSISSASGASIASGAGSSAISPDGRRVVFVGDDAEGHQGLWIQELDQVRARPLAGTEGASYPFWAPDSRRVGFFGRAKLRTISIDGGQVETLCDAVEGRGASWGRGGTIVFAPQVVGGLSAISENGGTPRVVTQIANPKEEQSHRLPAFLPDGRRFLYIADPGADTADGRVYLASLDGGEPRLLYRSRRAPIYAEPGYLIDAIDDRLVARPFDPKRGELLGEPRRLEERTPPIVNTQDRVASASTGGALLVASEFAGRLNLVALDRRGRTVAEIPLPKGAFVTLALSPDGGRVAMAGSESGDSREEDLWVVDLATERASRLTFAKGDQSYPVWSPDGEKIVFQSDRAGVYDLWIRPSSGGGEEQVLYASPFPWKQAYSWAGDTLAFETNFDIWLLHPDRPGEKPVQLLGSPASESSPTISPDARWLAYSSNESGRQQIYVVSLPDAKSRFQVTTEGGWHPIWTRKGDQIVYLTAENMIATVPVTRGASLAFGAPETLFPLPVRGQYGSDTRIFDVSADGNRILLLEPQGGNGATLTVVINWLAELDRKVGPS